MDTPNLFDLTGKRALVTGSSRGIGRALAEGLAGAGAQIILNGRNQQTLDDVAETIRANARQPHILSFDVTDPGAVAAAIDGFERDTGPIDILINNAGMQHRAPLDQFPIDKFDQLMRTNVNAAFYVGQAVARHMIPRQRGRIVNICSVMSMLARQSIAPYTASKGAIANLTKGMSADWACHGLNINGIAPGYIRTELNAALWSDDNFNTWLEQRTPAGRWAEASELVGAAIFLASDASSFVNGQVIYVDGGITATV